SPSPAPRCAPGWSSTGWATATPSMPPRWGGSSPWPAASAAPPRSWAASGSNGRGDVFPSCHRDRGRMPAMADAPRVPYEGDPHLGPVIVGEDDLRRRIAELGEQI